MMLNFSCLGHPNITSMHDKTFMFTKEDYVTPTGNCIIGINSSQTLLNLPEEFKKKLKSNDTKVLIKICCGGFSDSITAYGSPSLMFTDPIDMVIRKSTFICPRTFAIKADKSAMDLDRKLIEKISCGERINVEIILD